MAFFYISQTFIDIFLKYLLCGRTIFVVPDGEFVFTDSIRTKHFF
jgi:hypothetical protein